MTTFNITRNNDKANNNILLIGIAAVAIVAVIIAFAPALFSTSTVAVEGAPFGNGSNDGNFTVTTADGRLEGTTPNLTIYPSSDGATIITGDGVVEVTCGAGFVVPETNEIGISSYLEGDVDVYYSATFNTITVVEKDVAFVLDLDTCDWSKFLIPS